MRSEVGGGEPSYLGGVVVSLVLACAISFVVSSCRTEEEVAAEKAAVVEKCRRACVESGGMRYFDPYTDKCQCVQGERFHVYTYTVVD